MSSKPFTFELEAVLQVRHRDTDKASLHLAQAADMLANQVKVVDELNERLAILIAETVNQSGSHLLQLKRSSARQSQLRARVELEENKRQQLEAKHAAAKQVLLECRMKEESVVKLKEQALERHKRQIDEAEEAFADELIVIAGARMARGIR